MQSKLTQPEEGKLSGLTLVTGLNRALESLATDLSAATPPTAEILGISSLAGISYHNLTDGIVYRRDQADTVWMPVARIDQVTKRVEPLVGGEPIQAAKVMAAPTLTGSALAAVGGSYSLSMSAISGLSNAMIARFEITLPDGSVVTETAVSGAATKVWYVDGAAGQAKTFSVVAIDSLGNRSPAATKSVTLVNVSVAAPTITAPASGATGVSLTPTITTAAFACIGATDTHLSTSWRAYTGPGRTGTLLWSSDDDTTHKTSITVGTPLPAGSVVYLSVQHTGTTYGDSAWTEIAVTIAVVGTGAPTITAPASGATGIGSGPTLTITPTMIGGVTGTHDKTDWQITNADGTTVIWSSLDDTTHKTTITAPTGTLTATSTEHRARARTHTTEYGWGGWGEVSFTTAATFADVIGIALVTTGGGGGTWQRVDGSGNNLTGAAYNLGGSAYAAHAVWAGIVDQTIDGQAMVKVPKFYYRVDVAPAGSNQAGKVCWWISDQPVSGFVLHPAFYNAGGVVDQFWVGKYQSGEKAPYDKMVSLPGYPPDVSRALASFSALASARNTGGVSGFMLWSIYQFAAIQMLALIEAGGSNSQALIGRGRVDQSAAANVDAADVAQATYRGIVGLWGNVFQFVDGMKREDNCIKLWDGYGNKTWVTTEAYEAAYNYPVTIDGRYGSGWDLRAIFIGRTAATSASSSTFSDYQSVTANNVIVAVGGSYSSGDDCGLFLIYERGISQSLTNTGARLAKY